MSFRYSEKFINNIHRLLLEKKSIVEIMKITRASETFIRKVMCEKGIPHSLYVRMPTNRIKLPVEEIIRKYKEGVSILALSKEYGVSRIVIKNRLIENGEQFRSGSEANFLRMKKLSKEERMQLTKKAHDAVRGKTQSPKTRLRISTCRYIHQTHKGFGEDIFQAKLINLGYKVLGQFPLKGYNIDLLVNNSVAVEIASGGVSKVKSKHNRTKIKNILELGYSIIYLTFSNNNLFIKNLDNCIPFIEQICRDHCSIGPHYRVIRCTSDGESIGRFKRNHPTLVPPPVKYFCLSETLD